LFGGVLLGYILLSSAIVSLISVLGVVFLYGQSWAQKFVDFAVSFAIGAILANVFLHLFEEAFESYSLILGLFILLGILCFFIFEKYLHWHHCHRLEGHDHCIKPAGYMTLFADGVHNVFDGFLIATSYAISFSAGLSTTIAVILHELPQEIGELGLLVASGFRKSKAVLLNFISSLMIFLGVGLFYLLSTSFANIQPYLIAFVAGNFLYIAMSDLIPMLHEEKQLFKSGLQFIFIVLGIVVICLL